MTTREQKLQRLAQLIEEQQAEEYKRRWAHSIPPKVRVIPGKKYTKVDVGDSGKYMVDEEGQIYGIKAYGVIHRGHQYGTLDTIEQWDWSGYAAVPKR